VKQRILIVDDEYIIGETLKAYLDTHGFEAVIMTDAVALNQKLDSEVFNLVILDLALADADGLEVLEMLKQTHARLPVLILTGMGYDDDLMREAMRLRADGYMSKTAALPQLVSEIRRILRMTTAPASKVEQ
jgi:two-component system, OmpR family, response regulator QseB